MHDEFVSFEGACKYDDYGSLADLEKNCAIKEKEWAVTCKTQCEDLLALVDTVKILNDVDAPETFTK